MAEDVLIRVLVVEDTAQVREMISFMLDVDGFDVVGQAASGNEALDAVEGLDPDVVVIDYQMPMMDGLTTARSIREKRPNQSMILYTAFVDEDLQRRAEEVGVTVCLDKVEGLPSLEIEISKLCASI